MKEEKGFRSVSVHARVCVCVCVCVFSLVCALTAFVRFFVRNRSKHTTNLSVFFCGCESFARYSAFLGGFLSSIRRSVSSFSTASLSNFLPFLTGLARLVRYCVV